MPDLISKDLLLNILETNNIEEFRQFTTGPISASSCSADLARAFPEYANELNKPTVDEAWQAIQERKNRELYLNKLV